MPSPFRRRRLPREIHENRNHAHLFIKRKRIDDELVHFRQSFIILLSRRLRRRQKGKFRQQRVADFSSIIRGKIRREIRSRERPLVSFLPDLSDDFFRIFQYRSQNAALIRFRGSTSTTSSSSF
jgi:hypothetical protein